ncbi:MAG: hypothetical protein ABWK53_05240 [Anaerolineales bacterium]
MRNKTLFVAGIVLLAFVLAGCSMEYDTNVRPDQSGSMIMSIGFTADEMEMMSSGVSNPATFCQEMWAEENTDFPPNTIIRQEQRGSETWCIAEMPFADLQQLRSIYINQGITVNRLEVVDNVLYYDLSLDLSEASGSGLDIQMTWRVTLPGRVASHNAHAVSGQTLTWNLNIGSMNRIQAESSLSSNDWIWWLLGGLACLCLIVVVIGGAVGLFLYLRKKKAAAAS